MLLCDTVSSLVLWVGCNIGVLPSVSVVMKTLVHVYGLCSQTSLYWHTIPVSIWIQVKENGSLKVRMMDIGFTSLFHQGEGSWGISPNCATLCWSNSFWISYKGTSTVFC